MAEISEPLPNGLPANSSTAVIDFNASVARAARAFTGLSHQQIGKLALVSSRTVFKLEKDGKITAASLRKIITTYERKGVIIIYDDKGCAIGLNFRMY